MLPRDGERGIRFHMWIYVRLGYIYMLSDS